ncbi:MAG TPA: hypothetical protein VJ623_04840 [Holophagaceae bacterium]|nr:hypothetical protein [Holophagaceae bacterium]
MRPRSSGLIALALALPLSAQGGPPASRPRAAGQARIYQADREVSLKGTVVEVVTVPMGRSTGVHLKVKVAGREWPVHLGPSWFLAEGQWTFAKGDEVGFTGAKSGTGEGEFIIAREVTLKDKHLTLRDSAGLPAWSRRGRRP